MVFVGCLRLLILLLCGRRPRLILGHRSTGRRSIPLRLRLIHSGFQALRLFYPDVIFRLSGLPVRLRCRLHRIIFQLFQIPLRDLPLPLRLIHAALGILQSPLIILLGPDPVDLLFLLLQGAVFLLIGYLKTQFLYGDLLFPYLLFQIFQIHIK